jgi:hypothetical protein
MYVLVVLLLLYLAYQVALRRLILAKPDGDSDSEGPVATSARQRLLDRARSSWVSPIVGIAVLVAVVIAKDPSQGRYLLWGLAPIALAFGFILAAMKGWVGARGSKIGLGAFLVLGVIALAQFH